MSSQQIIKRRIKSVNNTRQITKAMQLVAASRLRRAQETALASQMYVERARDILATIAQQSAVSQNPLFREKPSTQTVLTILITSDRGLAGAYNANVMRTYTRMVNETTYTQQAICIGRYASNLIARTQDVTEVASYINTDMSASGADTLTAQPVLREAIDMFVKGRVDRVDMVYTKFYSTIRQEVVCETLLPIQTAMDTKGMQAKPKIEPGAQRFIEFAVNRILESQVLQAVLESQASEHASRMLAMKNATDNASDLIEDLTLEANKARQASITQELAEISAGAEAMK